MATVPVPEGSHTEVFPETPELSSAFSTQSIKVDKPVQRVKPEEAGLNNTEQEMSLFRPGGDSMHNGIRQDMQSELSEVRCPVPIPFRFIKICLLI